jgi:predicted NAD-dependent protein-ADP-ribosyltransferase YbiA (DUF1768 family)
LKEALLRHYGSLFVEAAVNDCIWGVGLHQNEHLKEALLRHYGSLFVEAAVNDCIWGVGLHQNDPLIRNRVNWRGSNLLGYILTDIVHRIFDEDKKH